MVPVARVDEIRLVLSVYRAGVSIGGGDGAVHGIADIDIHGNEVNRRIGEEPGRDLGEVDAEGRILVTWFFQGNQVKGAFYRQHMLGLVTRVISIDPDLGPFGIGIKHHVLGFRDKGQLTPHLERVLLGVSGGQGEIPCCRQPPGKGQGIIVIPGRDLEDGVCVKGRQVPVQRYRCPLGYRSEVHEPGCRDLRHGGIQACCLSCRDDNRR